MDRLGFSDLHVVHSCKGVAGFKVGSMSLLLNVLTIFSVFRVAEIAEMNRLRRVTSLTRQLDALPSKV